MRSKKDFLGATASGFNLLNANEAADKGIACRWRKRGVSGPSCYVSFKCKM